MSVKIKSDRELFQILDQSSKVFQKVNDKALELLNEIP